MSAIKEKPYALLVIFDGTSRRPVGIVDGTLEETAAALQVYATALKDPVDIQAEMEEVARVLKFRADRKAELEALGTPASVHVNGIKRTLELPDPPK